MSTYNKVIEIRDSYILIFNTVYKDKGVLVFLATHEYWYEYLRTTTRDVIQIGVSDKIDIDYWKEKAEELIDTGQFQRQLIAKKMK